jgi:uncharacterized protein
MSTASATEAPEPIGKAWSPPAFGTPAWISIPARDVGRAKAFYETVFDWKFRDSPDADAYPPSQFAMFLTPSPILMGGIIKVEEMTSGGNGGVMLYLRVEDFDTALEKVKSAGGSVVEEKIVEGKHTLRGKFADTEGNVVGILQWVSSAF